MQGKTAVCLKGAVGYLCIPARRNEYDKEVCAAARERTPLNDCVFSIYGNRDGLAKISGHILYRQARQAALIAKNEHIASKAIGADDFNRLVAADSFI